MVRWYCSTLAFSALVAAIAVTVNDRHAQARQPASTRNERCLTLQLYIRSDSELCQQAEKYAKTFSERRGGICLEIIDTAKDKDGLDRYWQLMRRFRVERPRVPVFYACGRLKVGFSDANKSAAAVEDLFAIHAYVRPALPRCHAVSNRIGNALARRAPGLS
jgi:hypothetical protein